MSRYKPKRQSKAFKTDIYLNSVNDLLSSIIVYRDHIADTSREMFSNRNAPVQLPVKEHSLSSDNSHSGILEAFRGDFCQTHSDILPMINDLQSSAMYSPILLEFEKHAAEGTNLRSVDRQADPTKLYARSTIVRHARQLVRESILTNGLPFPIGFLKDVIPGPIGTIFLMWRIPISTASRSDMRQTGAILDASSRIRRVLSRQQTLVYSKTIQSICESRGKLKASSAVALLEAFGFSSSTRTDLEDARVAKALTNLLGVRSETLLHKEGYVDALTEDLRSYNTRHKSKKLLQFFEAGKSFLDHSVSSTGARVDQRRAAEGDSGARMYMPVAMSLTDLRSSIAKYAVDVHGLVEGKDFIIPSLEWLRLQFQPQRPDALTAIHFTGLLGLHRTAQSRTIRQEHEDCHFVRPLWQYVRQWSHPLALLRQAVLVSVDDKCGVKIGEPGMPTSAVQRRRRQSIYRYETGTVSAPLAADHDYSNVTLTPSVTLFIEPPEEPLGSYCRGSPFLTIKNAVFQPSNPCRHAAELVRSIRHQYAGATIPVVRVAPVLVVFSDGGSDHRTNLYSVQLTFLWVMVYLNLDEVVCVRTAPGDSWVNPAERRMADLNIAWEASSFARRYATADQTIPVDHARWFETAMKSASSMAAVRKLVNHEDAHSNSIDVPAILASSVRPVVEAMRDSVSRIEGEANAKWVVMSSASQEECDSVTSFLQNEVCSDLDSDKMQAAVVEGSTAELILKAHKIETCRYMFHLRKLLVDQEKNPCIPNCPVCTLTPRLPPHLAREVSPVPFPVMKEDGRYTDFQELYKPAGSEGPPPNFQKSLAPRSAKIATSGTVCRDIQICSNCNRPRAIYSRLKRSFTLAAQLLLESRNQLTFVCGTTSLFPDALSETHPHLLRNHPDCNGAVNSMEALEKLREAVYVQSDLSCNDCIEESIYNSPHISVGRKEMCCFCGTYGALQRERREFCQESAQNSGKSQTSRPFCPSCRAYNVPRFPRTRNKRKNAAILRGGKSQKVSRTVRNGAASSSGQDQGDAPPAPHRASEVSETPSDVGPMGTVPVHTSPSREGPGAELSITQQVPETARNNPGNDAIPLPGIPSTHTAHSHCAAGPGVCWSFLKGTYSEPTHTCKFDACPSRSLGLHNMCNILRSKPHLLPRSLAAEGAEGVYFCSETCTSGYSSIENLPDEES